MNRSAKLRAEGSSVTSTPWRRGRPLFVALALVGIACAGPPPLTACEPGDGWTTVCGFVNPEDLVVLPGGEWFLVSQFPQLGAEDPDPGSLLAFRPGDGARKPLFPLDAAAAPAALDGTDPACPGPPDPAQFGPHGIDLSRDGRHLWVVNHGERESIERFALDPSGPSLRWAGCVPLPEGDQANDVASLPGGGFVATRMLPAEPGIGTFFAMLFGRPTGHVLLWRPGEGWSTVPDSEMVAPNGIAAGADGDTVYVAEWGGDRIVRLGLDGSARTSAALPHHPDNLSWRADGALLSAGQHGSLASLLACGEIESGACAIPFSVAAIDPTSLEVRTIATHDPATHAGAASVALEHDGRLWVGAFASDRLVHRPALEEGSP